MYPRSPYAATFLLVVVAGGCSGSTPPATTSQGGASDTPPAFGMKSESPARKIPSAPSETLSQTGQTWRELPKAPDAAPVFVSESDTPEQNTAAAAPATSPQAIQPSRDPPKPNGTFRIVADSFVGCQPVICGERLFFVARECELWSTDGTAQGTRLASNRPRDAVRQLTAFRDRVFYFDNSRDLWCCDGTEDGTRRLKSNIGITFPLLTMVAYRDAVYFTGWDADRFQSDALWKTDGTQRGTVPVWGEPVKSSYSSGIRPYGLMVFGDHLLFFNHQGMWASDGTGTNTRLLAPVWFTRDEDAVFEGQHAAFLNGSLYFSAWNRECRHGLWRTTGTSESTAMVKNPEWLSSVPTSRIVTWKNRVFFTGKIDTAEHPDAGWELCCTDGTGEGTILLKDLNPNGDSTPRFYMPLRDCLLFYAYSYHGGAALYRTDGTDSGTVRLRALDDRITTAMVSEGQAWFVSKRCLWRSDGTENGTQRIAQIPWEHADYGSMCAMNGRILLFDTNRHRIVAYETCPPLQDRQVAAQ